MNIVIRFVLQMIIGAILFAIVAGVAYLLWLGTEWLRQKGVPDHFYLAAWACTELLFWLDVLCFVVFVVGEAIKLVRDIIRDIWN
jgi:hypothetical protein